MMQRILVADDDDGLRDALGELFARLGFQVLEAADGHAALRVWREANPLLSILDVHMPGLTGIQVLEALHRMRSGPLPCILVSAEATDRERDAALAFGAFDFLSKPFDIDRLLTRVDELCRTFAGTTPFGPDHPLSRLLGAHVRRLLGPMPTSANELPVPLDLLFRPLFRPLFPPARNRPNDSKQPNDPNPPSTNS
ncbi:MAG: response regulator [Planctomycetes bacterium]|nr:response regulator [Planctomycetota bacterium]